MDTKFANELKRLADEMNNLTAEIKADTKQKIIQYDNERSELYDIMKADLEQMRQLVQDAGIRQIIVPIPCDFTDSNICEFDFMFPGTRFSNHKEVGLEWIYGNSTGNPGRREFKGWLYSWVYSKGVIEQESSYWTSKYIKQLFDHIIDNWSDIKPEVEREFVKQYKLWLTNRVQKAIRDNEEV